jgi:hypothetical protein
MFNTLLLACGTGLSLVPLAGAEADSTRRVHRGNEFGTDAAHDVAFALTNSASSWCSLDRWSFQAGVAFITESTIDEVASMGTELADGDAAGQIYLVQVSYKAAELKPSIFGHRVEIDVELPLVLGIVDERGSDPFVQYSGGVTLRWKTFPWNRWVYTTFETGIGLTYSQRVLAAERARHPRRDRSHLEFYWPVQLTLALPDLRQHQLVLFLHHHSGGGVFHRGGANSLGVGYRFVPGEKSTRVEP